MAALHTILACQNSPGLQVQLTPADDMLCQRQVPLGCMLASTFLRKSGKRYLLVSTKSSMSVSHKRPAGKPSGMNSDSSSSRLRYRLRCIGALAVSVLPSSFICTVFPSIIMASAERHVTASFLPNLVGTLVFSTRLHIMDKTCS